jgi:hypothetical protein
MHRMMEYAQREGKVRKIAPFLFKLHEKRHLVNLGQCEALETNCYDASQLRDPPHPFHLLPPYSEKMD